MSGLRPADRAGIFDGLAAGIDRYAHFVVCCRWWIVLASLLLSVIVAGGVTFLGFNNEYRVFFSEENPHLQAFDKQQATYTKNDNVLFVVTPQNGDVFTPEALSAVEEITREAWLLPFALRVDSVTNFQYSRADGDDLLVGDLVEEAMSLSREELLAAKNVALSEPFLLGQLINQAASVTAVNITFQMPQIETNEAPRAAAAVKVLKEQIEKNYPVDVHLTGVVMLSNAFFEATLQDMQTLLPAMYGIIIVVLLVLLRSIGATLATVVIIILSMMVAMGGAGWAGIELTPPSSSATTIIMTLAVADSVHFLIGMFAGMRDGMSRHKAIRHSLRLNMGPIFLTSATTAIGFLSMNFSDAPPFHDLGNITAFGVFVAFLLSVSLLPALMAIIPVKASKGQALFSGWMNMLSDFVIQKRNGIFAVTAIAGLLLTASIPLNIFDDNFVDYFDETVQFRTDTDYVNEKLTGIYQIQYSLDAGKEDGVGDPDFLQKVDHFVQWFRSQPEVTHVNAVTDTFKRLNKNMHADDPEKYTLPEDKALADQFLVLYSLSLPEGMDMLNQLDIGNRATQVIVTLKDLPSQKIAEIADRGRHWLKNEVDLDAYGVGPAVMFAYISETNIRSMLTGTSVAILIISLLITFSLRDLRLGVISLVPNLLPLAAAFGLWGLLIGQVNVAVSMVSGMALGIVVDDTVHFLSKYLRARREQNLDREGAVRYAFSSVGVAIVVTSMVLVAGFSVLAQSHFGMNSSMAMLTAIAITLALVLDFLLLPVLLLKLDKRERGQNDGVQTGDVQTGDAQTGDAQTVDLTAE